MVNQPLNLSDIKNKLKSMKQDFNKEVSIEIRKRLLNPSTAEPYIAQTFAILTEMQAMYWGGGGSAAEEDPTKLTIAEYGEVVRSEILKNFGRAAKTMDPVSGTVNLVLLSNDFLGLGNEGDTKGTRPIQWLAYFLSGNLENNLYWINPENYAIFKGAVGGATGLGRFGLGELWGISDQGSIQRMNAQLKAAGKSYNMESLKHPQSGKPGRDWFASVWDTVDFYAHVHQPAIDTAVERLQNRLFK